VHQPWRMACAWLSVSLGARPRLPRALRRRVSPRDWGQVAELARTGIATPSTTSVGRLFDAVAALCGLRTEVNYEGQAAIELEAALDRADTAAYPMRVAGAELDARPTIRAVVRDVEDGVTVGRVAARFHNALSAASADACAHAAARFGLDAVVLSGGVFQNRTLLDRTASLLRERRLRVLVPARLPANDGGISYGQLAVASARLASEEGNGHVRV
jgi:hydrogenase maturation protein HypF